MAHRVAPDRFWPDIRLDLTGATLLDFDLSNCQLGNATFGGASFAGNAWFDQTTFAGAAWFDKASFAGIAWFNGTTSAMTCCGASTVVVGASATPGPS